MDVEATTQYIYTIIADELNWPQESNTHIKYLYNEIRYESYIGDAELSHGGIIVLIRYYTDETWISCMPAKKSTSIHYATIQRTLILNEDFASHETVKRKIETMLYNIKILIKTPPNRTSN
jgi:hypothetical protein